MFEFSSKGQRQYPFLVERMHFSTTAPYPSSRESFPKSSFPETILQLFLFSAEYRASPARTHVQKFRALSYEEVAEKNKNNRYVGRGGRLGSGVFRIARRHLERFRFVATIVRRRELAKWQE